MTEKKIIWQVPGSIEHTIPNGARVYFQANNKCIEVWLDELGQFHHQVVNVRK